jgi:hypothetical protein
MKLRKQTQLKTALAAVVGGLLAGFFALVRSESHVKAAVEPMPTTPVDYGRFFAPNQPAPGAASPPTAVPRRPHTRTRAS